MLPCIVRKEKKKEKRKMKIAPTIIYIYHRKWVFLGLTNLVHSGSVTALLTCWRDQELRVTQWLSPRHRLRQRHSLSTQGVTGYRQQAIGGAYGLAVAFITFYSTSNF